ncbi:LysR family transcriptional regulator, partial [Ascidiaceihabitans sp.]|nr:LysR family transcriptional regulator [Ascidiaceihabitans sp.]
QLTWADVAPHRFIANGSCSMVQDPEFAPILEGSLIMASTTISLLALVNAGVGITVLPEQALPSTYSDLVFLKLFNINEIRKVSIASLPESELTPAVKSFLKILKVN